MTGLPRISSFAAIVCIMHAVATGAACAPTEANEAPDAKEGSRPPDTAAPSPSTNTAPRGVGEPLPDLAWEGLGEDGRPRSIALRDYREPMAASPHLLVVRVQGGTWCGTCLWHAAHTRELSSPRVRVLDLVVGDRDNAPARPSDLAEWRARLDAPEGVAIGADPSFALRGLGPESGVMMPFFVLVDTRTLRAIDTASNPDPEALATKVDAAIATIDGVPPPAPRREPPVDAVFRRNEWDMIRDMRLALGGAPPADPTNAVADSAAAAALGKALFFDASLSANGAVSCASCHDPTKQLTDGRPTALGMGVGKRKTPRIALAASARWQLWDGRADTLWAQALLPIEDPAEIGSSRIALVRRVASAYPAELAAAFPSLALPTSAELAELPSSGMPGDPAYDALPAPVRERVTRVAVAAAKSIAAYERTFRVVPNRLDAYAAGDVGALTTDEKQGLALFARVGCTQCHWGPRLTDDAFHVTRLRGSAGAIDRGRRDGLVRLASAELAGGSRWSDAPSLGRAVRDDAGAALVGAFKTPPLRGVASIAAAPFGHGGAETSLVTVTEVYGSGGAPADDPSAIGVLEPWLMRFDVTAQWAIPTFLEVLTAEPIVP